MDTFIDILVKFDKIWIGFAMLSLLTNIYILDLLT